MRRNARRSNHNTLSYFQTTQTTKKAAVVALRWSPFGHEVLHKHLELGPTLKRQAIEWVSNATKLAMFCRSVTSDIIFRKKVKKPTRWNQITRAKRSLMLVTMLFMMMRMTLTLFPFHNTSFICTKVEKKIKNSYQTFPFPFVFIK